MGTIVSLVLLLLALGPRLLVDHRPGQGVQYADLYGNKRSTPIALECTASHGPILWVSDQPPPLEMLVHELAHAVDCVDNGYLDGSPGTGSGRPAVRPAWAQDYCWDSDAEWYACTFPGAKR